MLALFLDVGADKHAAVGAKEQRNRRKQWVGCMIFELSKCGNALILNGLMTGRSGDSRLHSYVERMYSSRCEDIKKKSTCSFVCV